MAEVPIGAIVQYGCPDDSLLPWNWRICDGSQMTTSQYPDLARVLLGPLETQPGQFSLPDLQGRFLRGATEGAEKAVKFNPAGQPVLQPSQTYDFKTGQDPNSAISVRFQTTPNGSWDNCLLSDGPDMVRWDGNSSTFGVNSDHKETRPDNVYLYFIIKIQKASATPPENSKVQAANIPVGAIVAFAGADNTNPGTSPDWIACNGYRVAFSDGANIQALSTAVMGRFQPPSAPQDAFTPPDLRGMFIRGVDLGGNLDKESGGRNPAPDGSAQGVGTWQEWATYFNDCRVTIDHYSTRGDQYTGGSGNYHLANGHTSDSQVWLGGGSETRPNNAAVSYWINSQPDDKLSEIPVGCIIALVEPHHQTTTMKGHWKYCNGANDLSDIFETLHTVLGTTWGDGDIADDTAIPDFQGQFLRGSSASGSAYNRDPDASSRVANAKGGASSGTGSFQQWATARNNSVRVPGFSYPTANDHNPTDYVDDKYSHYLAHYDTDRAFDVQFPQNESAPCAMIVNFYIRVM